MEEGTANQIAQTDVEGGSKAANQRWIDILLALFQTGQALAPEISPGSKLADAHPLALTHLTQTT